MIRHLQLTILITALLLGSTASQVFAQQNYYWRSATTGATANGDNWSNTANWRIRNADGTFSTTTILPTSSDNVFFDAGSFSKTGYILTVNVAAACANMDWTGATNTPTLAGTSSLTINGSLTFIPLMNVTFTGPVTFASAGTASVTSATKTLNNVAFNSGTYNLQDNLTVNGNLTIATATLNANSRNIALTGNWSSSTGTFNPGTGTVSFSGTGTAGISTSSSFNNLTIGKSINLTSLLSLTGSLSMSTGTFTTNGHNITLAGNWSMTGGTFTHGNNTVTFESGATASSLTSTGTFYNLVMNKPVTLTGAISVANDLDLRAGTLNANGQTITLGRDMLSNGGTFAHGNNTVIFNGSSAIILPSLIFHSITIAKTGTTSVDLSGPLSLTGNLSVSGGTLDAKGHNITLAGNWSMTGGSFIHGNNTVTFEGGATASNLTSTGAFYNLVMNKSVTLTGAISVDNNLTSTAGTFLHNNHNVTFSGSTSVVIPANITFHSITIAKIDPVASVNVDLAGPLSLSGGLIISGGILNSNNHNITLAGNWSMTGGTYIPGTNTVTFTGTAPSLSLTNSSTFNNLAINSGATATLASPIIVNGNFTLAGTLSAGANSITLGGNWSSTGTFNAGTGTVIFNGAASTISTNSAFNHLTIASGATANLSSAIIINGNLDLAGTLNAGAHNITLGGQWIANGGTFTQSGNTVIFTGTTSIDLPSATFHSVTIAKTAPASVTLTQPLTLTGNLAITSGTLSAGANSITLAGNWSSTGTFNPGTGTVVFNGAASTITTNTTSPFNHLTISSGATANLSSAITVNGNLDLAGTLNANGNTITLGGNWLANGGSFTHGGNTVIFNGATSVTLPSANFHSVTIAKTAPAAVTLSQPLTLTGNLAITAGTLATGGQAVNVAGNISVTGGIFNATNSSITLAGNWSMTGGIFTNTGSTVTLQGGTAATVGSTGAFNNLIVNKTASLSSPVTISRDLTITGALSDNGNLLTGNATGTMRMSGTATLTLTNNVALPNSAMPQFANYNLDATTTVTYGAGALGIRGLTTANGTGYGNLVITGTNTTKTLTGNITIQGNLDLQSGTLAANTRTINIQGNWTGSGTFTAGTGTVRFYGNTNSSISTTTNLSLYNLIIDKSSKVNTVTLGTMVRILANGTATFRTGIVKTTTTYPMDSKGDPILSDPATSTSPGYLLIFSDNANVSGASHNSHVDGYVRKEGNDNFEFPIGNGEYYRPAGVSAYNTSGTYIYDARYINRLSTGDTRYDYTKGRSPVKGVSKYEYWHIVTVQPNSSPRIWLSWEMPISGGFEDPNYISPENVWMLTTATWKADSKGNFAWEDRGIAGVQILDNNRATFRGRFEATSATNSNTHLFSIGSTVNTLPVTLVSFKAKVVNNQVVLDWQSSKETNVSHYTVERSGADMKFQAVKDVKAKGESVALISYTATDAQPLTGTSYYRLKMVDNDGTYEYSKVVSVTVQVSGNVEAQKITLYPNPSDGKSLNFNVGAADAPVTVSLFDIIGNPVQYTIIDNSNGLIAVAFNETLPTGMYVAVITNTLTRQTTFLKYIVK